MSSTGRTKRDRTPTPNELPTETEPTTPKKQKVNHDSTTTGSTTTTTTTTTTASCSESVDTNPKPILDDDSKPTLDDDQQPLLEKTIGAGTSSKAVRTEVAYPKNYPKPTDSEIAQMRAKIKERDPARSYAFTLDPFQQESIAAIERGESVLVSAHTSAGKTVVAEYAIAMSLRDQQRVIYTSPIKALSNQKFRELQEIFTDVGLMTGDITINPNSSCLVMTTEILRSMLYRGSEVMREVQWVIFDEIHYLRDKERGVVWEETIILLPHKVRYVFLSATIPNAFEFASWIAELHYQPCNVVYTDYRPTPLQHYIFPAGGAGLHLVVDEQGKFREENFQRALSSLISQKQEGNTSGASSSVTSRDRRAANKQAVNDCYKIVKMIMERQYQPVIVFSFSKKDCEQRALQMSKLDFNNDQEKEMLEMVFNNAVDALSDEDKGLPQVQKILPLLKRGIGIHHSGLLPILKEVIEILFQEGLLKALFATETFSMGLNMPAKTVVFTSVRKFDGKNFRYVRSGEYIQMSGRAGRRGLDDRGIVILMVDEKMEPSVAKEMVKGLADPLYSEFHLGYNMLLNLLRVEDVNPVYLIKRSFRQFQDQQKWPKLKQQLATIEKQKKQLDIDGEPLLKRYFAIKTQIDRYLNQNAQITNKPIHALRFLQSGRLVHVRNGSRDFGWGPVVSFTPLKQRSYRKPADAASSSSSSLEHASSKDYVVDVLLWVIPPDESENHLATMDESGASARQPEPLLDLNDSKGQMCVVPVLLSLVVGFSSLRTFVPKNLGAKTQLKSVWKSLLQAERRYPKGVPLLDPYKDMEITDSQFRTNEERIASLRVQLDKVRTAYFEAHPPPSAEDLLSDKERAKLERKRRRAPPPTSSTKKKKGKRQSSAITASSSTSSNATPPPPMETYPKYINYCKKMALEQDAQVIRNQLRSSNKVIMQDQLKAMQRILRRLGYTNSENIIALKGRVACEINAGDELVLTELIFDGVFNDLNTEQIVALLSCFVFEEKATTQQKLHQELAAPLRKLQEIARRIANISIECKLHVDVDQYIQSFSPAIMDVVYAWCRGASFAEVCTMTHIFEGSIIRCMRRLEELLRQLANAAKAIGNGDLEKKFAEGISKIKRDIVFAASLYL